MTPYHAARPSLAALVALFLAASAPQATARPLCDQPSNEPAIPTSCEVYDTGRTPGSQPALLGPLASLKPEWLVPRWLDAKFLLLGEVHDNFQHHLLRAKIVAALASQKPAVVFEQIRADQQPGLDQFALFDQTAARLGTASDLLRFLDWNHQSWSKTSDYRPLFAAAVQARLPIYPGDPPRDAIRSAAKEGAAAIPAGDRTRLALDTPLPDAANAASLIEIEGSHCGMIPKSAHANMAYAQRYRDAHLADVLMRAASSHGRAILIAGNGHVRADRGVPWYLHARAPDAKIVSVLFVEVEDGNDDPASYLERDPEGRPIADYVVFTPKAPRAKDPCEGMKPKPEKN